MPMKIAVFGGSFNPPHNGHIDAANAFSREFAPDRLLLIPSNIPPHKRLSEDSPPAEERLLLTTLAAESIETPKTKTSPMVEVSANPAAVGVSENTPVVEVSDAEIKRGGESFTADTVRELADFYRAANGVSADAADPEIYLLMGADMFLSVEGWYNFGKILESCILVPFPRRDGETEKIKAHAEYLERRYGANTRKQTAEPEHKGVKIQILYKHALDISSTEVRETLKNGGGAELLPQKVYERIIQKRLYGAVPDLAWLREKAIEMLAPSRVPHVLGTEHEAVRLAERYGADLREAAEAAILHDITKKISDEEQLKLCEECGIMSDNAMLPPKLLHAKTGAAVAKTRFGVSDSVYNAISWHTTGRADMTLLEKIIYLADYIEPGRSFDGLDELRRLAYENLDRAMLLGLKMSMEEVISKGREVSGSTAEAYNYLLNAKE